MVPVGLSDSTNPMGYCVPVHERGESIVTLWMWRAHGFDNNQIVFG